MSRPVTADFVCAECFSDEGIQAFIEGHVESNECDFCGATGDEPIAAPFHEVAEHIFSCIGKDYDDPSNAGMGYDSGEGGWFGADLYNRRDIDEVGLDFPNEGGDRLRDELASSSDIDLWSESEPYRLNPYERLKFSWEEFGRVIQHKCRTSSTCMGAMKMMLDI